MDLMFCSAVGAGLLMYENGCYYQAKYNREHAYAARGLTMVVGSLGIGKDQPFYEFGGLDYTTVAHFKKMVLFGQVFWDAHVWLEDADGRVYDIITGGMRMCAECRGKAMDFKVEDVIERADKRSLAERGLVYLPAPPLTQAVMLQLLSRQRDEMYDARLSMFDSLVLQRRTASQQGS